MVNVVVVGLGPIGLAAAEAVGAQRDMRLVGAVDVDPGKVGRRVGELLREGAPPQASAGALDVAVTREFPGSGADVAIVCTTSAFDGLAPLLREMMERRVNVVTSCEEMSWPWYRHPQLADAIDAEAKRAGVALLGTGVNPGYVMDLLAVQLSSMTLGVSSVRCVRRVDVSRRRKPLQAKVGSTMSVEQFETLKAQDRIGHKGIAESVAMLAAGLGRKAASGAVRVTLEPVVATRRVASLVGEVEPGRVCGMRNTATWSGDGLSIELDLTMALELEDPHDAVEIRAASLTEPLTLRIPGSTPGDTATVAALVNAARVIAGGLLGATVAPGLRTMLDLPAASARG